MNSLSFKSCSNILKLLGGQKKMKSYLVYLSGLALAVFKFCIGILLVKNLV